MKAYLRILICADCGFEMEARPSFESFPRRKFRCCNEACDKFGLLCWAPEIELELAPEHQQPSPFQET